MGKELLSMLCLLVAHFACLCLLVLKHGSKPIAVSLDLAALMPDAHLSALSLRSLLLFELLSTSCELAMVAQSLHESFPEGLWLILLVLFLLKYESGDSDWITLERSEGSVFELAGVGNAHGVLKHHHLALFSLLLLSQLGLNLKDSSPLSSLQDLLEGRPALLSLLLGLFPHLGSDDDYFVDALLFAQAASQRES